MIRPIAIRPILATVVAVGLALGVAPTASAVPEPGPPGDPVAVAVPTPTVTEVPSPRRLLVPGLGIDTKIYASGLDKYRNVQIPTNIDTVGWYRLGVPPGVDRGAAVIVGHRDAPGRRGAFYNLGRLRPGQVVTVTTSSKKALRYRITKVRSILKKRLPVESIFGVSGRHRLVLISCGGYYDRRNGGYQDNVVVTAEPLFTPVHVPPVKGS